MRLSGLAKAINLTDRVSGSTFILTLWQLMFFTITFFFFLTSLAYSNCFQIVFSPFFISEVCHQKETFSFFFLSFHILDVSKI
jgi:hypothetical protein